MKLLEKAIVYQKKQSNSIKNNQKEITFNNWKMLNSMLVIGCLTFGTFFLLSFFLESYHVLTVNYGIVTCFLFGYLLCTKYFLKNINPVYLIYLGYAIMIAYSIYSSAFVTPEDTCVIILFLLFQLPIIIVDTSWRVNIIECIFAIAYLIIAVPFKQQSLFVDEVVNCALFTGVSIILGEYMRDIKIDNYELNRQATIREKYDFLTNLGNRRNLFEKLERLKHQNNVAIIMLDVDNFKLYNDNYGHQQGDRCLVQLSALLRDFGEKNYIEFFRYGGEEFIGVIENIKDSNLLELCNSLNKLVFGLQIPHKAVETEFVTISIGISNIKNNDDFKELLTQADNALYHAKANGRNTSMLYGDCLKKENEVTNLEYLDYVKKYVDRYPL